MISNSAKAGFDYMLTAAMKASFLASSDQPCEVNPIESTGQIKEQQAVILTVSSYLFRVLTLIHFTLDAPMKAHLASINRAEVDDMDDRALLDVISECSNVCSGALNRELGSSTRTLGCRPPTC